VRIERLPPIGDVARVPFVLETVRALHQQAPLARAFVAGDGAVNYAVLDELCDSGVYVTRDTVESFFNMPKKSA
jgi:hypothetical protein